MALRPHINGHGNNCPVLVIIVSSGYVTPSVSKRLRLRLMRSFRQAAEKRSFRLLQEMYPPALLYAQRDMQQGVITS